MIEKIKNLFNKKNSAEQEEEIINDSAKSKKKTVARYCAGFIVFMIVCSFIARGIYATQLAQVTVGTCEEKSLAKELVADGHVTDGKDQAVVVVPGLRVQEVCVKVGENVTPKTLLMRVDITDLQKLITQMKQSLSVEQKKIAALKTSEKQSTKSQKTAVSRAKQNVKTVTAQQNAIISQLQQDYEDAVTEASKYTTWEKYRAGVDEKEAMTKREWESAAQTAQAAVKEKKAALRIGLADRDAAILTVKQALVDAKQSKNQTDSVGSIAEEQVTLEKLQQQLNDYQSVQTTGGKVYCSKSGVVKEIKTLAGERTVDGAAVVLQDGTAGWNFTAKLSEEQQQDLTVGKTVTVSFSKEKIEIKDALVESITENEEGTYDVVVILHSKDKSGDSKGDNKDWKRVTFGMKGTMRVSSQSEHYDCCVPLSALYAEGNKNYVMLLREKPGILGTELCSVRIDVDILEKNEEYAALKNNPLSEKDKIVLSTSKIIQSGDKVRLLEE